MNIPPSLLPPPVMSGTVAMSGMGQQVQGKLHVTLLPASDRSSWKGVSSLLSLVSCISPPLSPLLPLSSWWALCSVLKRMSSLFRQL